MPRGRKALLTREKIIAALDETGGVYGEIAKKLKCSRETVYNYMKDDEDLQKLRTIEEEKLLDLAEGKLIQSIKLGENWGVAFILRTKGRKRGYVERSEIAGVSDEPLQIAVFPVNWTGPKEIDFKDKKLLEQTALSLIDDAITIEPTEVVDAEVDGNQSVLRECSESKENSSEQRRSEIQQELQSDSIINIEMVERKQ